MQTSIALLILRLVGGAFMLTHGWPKFQLLLGGAPFDFPDPLGIGVTTSLVLTVFAEFLCALLLLVGLFTRLVSIPLIITMLVAAFIVHGQDGFGKMELALLYAGIYLALSLLGAGRYSIDALRKSK